MLDASGHTLFGAIDQLYLQAPPQPRDATLIPSGEEANFVSDSADECDVRKAASCICGVTHRSLALDGETKFSYNSKTGGRSAGTCVARCGTAGGETLQG